MTEVPGSLWKDKHEAWQAKHLRDHSQKGGGVLRVFWFARKPSELPGDQRIAYRPRFEENARHGVGCLHASRN